jgi:hypothetical protein
VKSITSQAIIAMLIRQVPVAPAEEYAENCRLIGMREQRLQHRESALSVAGASLPTFDKFRHFVFILDDLEGVEFEILEREGMILQAGYQVHFRSSMFSFRPKKFFERSVQVLESHYGPGIPMEQPSMHLFNYGDVSTVAYVSLSQTSFSKSLSLRVGNRRFGW